MNSVFCLQMQYTVGDTMVIGVAVSLWRGGLKVKLERLVGEWGVSFHKVGSIFP